MIVFKGFQGLKNFYIKFKDFPDFSRICTNPDSKGTQTETTGNDKQHLCLHCTDAYNALKIYNYALHELL